MNDLTETIRKHSKQATREELIQDVEQIKADLGFNDMDSVRAILDAVLSGANYIDVIKGEKMFKAGIIPDFTKTLNM